MFARTDKFKLAPLHLALEGGNLELVVFILDYLRYWWPKKQLYSPDLAGKKSSAWQDAIRFGQWEVMHFKMHSLF